MKTDEPRFVMTYSQGFSDILEIWVDRETGVNYLAYCSAGGRSLTVLLDRAGNPVITTVNEEE